MRGDVTTRFFAKVRKTETCWLWTGSKDGGGYGFFRVPGGHEKAHRFSWIIHNGPIPDGLFVLHDCPFGDRRDCVNPEHLWTGTQRQNVADMDAKGRRMAAVGARNSHAKLDDFTVLELRAVAEDLTRRELCARFGLSKTQVARILRREQWTHLP